MDAQLMRALKPKITPAAAVRMHGEYLTGIAVTTMTLGLLWTAAFAETWGKVMWPEARK